MKKFKISLILVAFGLLFSIGVMAQGPPTPPSDPTAGGNQIPGGGGPAGAPIDGGTSILLLLAAGYGLKKIRGVNKTQNL
jgi:hypothetical protein